MFLLLTVSNMFESFGTRFCVPEVLAGFARDFVCLKGALFMGCLTCFSHMTISSPSFRCALRTVRSDERLCGGWPMRPNGVTSIVVTAGSTIYQSAATNAFSVSATPCASKTNRTHVVFHSDGLFVKHRPVFAIAVAYRHYPIDVDLVQRFWWGSVGWFHVCAWAHLCWIFQLLCLIFLQINDWKHSLII